MKIVDLFFPPVCPVCNGHTGKNTLCDVCREKMKEFEAPSKKHISVDGKAVAGYSFYNYGSKVFEKYVFALKRRGNEELFLHAASKLLTIVPSEFVSPETVVTAVPRRKSNVREYGYDQSCKAAKYLAEISGAGYEVLLKRKGFSAEQKNLDARQRRSNVSGKFRAVYKPNVTSVILVDDVLTTGSSFSECVREIRKVYGNDVSVIGVFLSAKNVGEHEYV